MEQISSVFECYFFVDQAYPDGAWPVIAQQFTDATVVRFMRGHPNRSIIEDTRSCIDSTDPRFPDNMPCDKTHVLIRQIKLDRALKVDE